MTLKNYALVTTKGGAQSFALGNFTLDGTTLTGPSENTVFIVKNSLSLKNNAVLKLDGASVNFKTAQTDRLTDGGSKIRFWQENTGNPEVRSEIVFERGGTLYLDDFEWDTSVEHESHSALFTVGNESTISATLDVKGSSDRAELIVRENSVLNIAENNATYHTVRVYGGGTANLSSDVTLYWLDIDTRSSKAANINVKGNVLANTFRTTGGNTYKNAKIKIDGKLTFNATEQQYRIPYADFTGKGTLELAADGKGRSGTIGGTFGNFGTLAVTADGGDASLTLDLQGDSNTVDKLLFSGTDSAKLTVKGILTVKSSEFKAASNEIVLNSGAELNFDSSASNMDNVKISGEGTLGLLNNTSMTFGGSDDIKLSGLKIYNGTATIAEDMTIENVIFMLENGGKLKIDDDKTLTVTNLVMHPGNTLEGGILKVTGDISLGNITKLQGLIVGGSTTFTGDSVIDTLSGTGDVVIADGVTLTINKKLDLSPNNIVYGAQNTGTLVLNGTDNKIATKAKILGTLRIGENGAVTFYDDAVIGTLDSRGTTTVEAGKTLEIRQSYSGTLNAADATLKLTGSAQGTFAAGDGSSIGSLEIAGDGAKATFNGAYALNDLTLSKGQVEINDELTLANGTFTGGEVGGTGGLKLAGTLTIGAGADVSVSNLAFDANGKLKLNGQLTVNNELDYRGHLVDAGNGTLTLGAKGTFGGTFMGTVRIGRTTAEIAEDAVFKALDFTGTGGVLTIADGATLEIAALDATGNTVSGGNLKLTNGAIFDTAVLNGLTAGADVVVNKSLTVNGTLSAAAVYGDGELTLTNGGSLTTGGKVLGTLSGGRATFTGDSTVGTLNASATINVGKTLTVTTAVGDGVAVSGDGLLLLDGATAAFGSASIKNLKLNNAAVDLKGELTVASLYAGDTASTLTGGTLTLTGNAAFNGTMNIDALNVNAGTFTFGGTTGDVRNMTLADGAKLSIESGELNAYGFTGTNNTVTIAENAAFGLDLGNSQALPTGLTIGGAGYLSLLNETSLTFAGNAGEFGELGGLQVMRGTVTITADTNVKNFRFGDTAGGTLNIESGTFGVSKITTKSDNNKIIGKGTLKLTDGDSVFNSALDGETKIVIGGKASALFNGKTVLPTLTVENGGGVGAGENGSVSITELSITNGKIFGKGVLKAGKLSLNGGTTKVAGGLTAETIENGMLEIIENGALELDGSVLTDAAITMTDGLLSLKTDYALSALNLTLNGGTVSFGTLTVDAAFANAGGKLSGTKLIWAYDGTLNAQADVDTLQVDAGLTLANDTAVNTLSFGANGALTLNGVLTVNGALNLTRDIAGNGTLIAAGDATLGAGFGGTLQIGTDTKAGTATVVSDAVFGGLTFGGKGGSVKINAGKRLSVPTISVSSGGTVSGDGTLVLTGTGSVLGANLSVAEIELSGQATAKAASVNGLTLKDGGRMDVENSLNVTALKQTGTGGTINGGTLTIQSAAVETDLTLNNAAAAISSLSGAGALRLNGSDTVLSQANIGTLAVSGGTLDIGKNQIAANTFTMENGTLKLQIGKDATDGNGNATGVGHGKITGDATVSNSALFIEVAYNTYITKDGTVFKLFDGAQDGAFNEIANEKYKITAEGNGNYRIAKLHTSAENVGNAGGNKNQQNTADGLLDRAPFDEGDKTHGLAEELNRLEQTSKQDFLNGLTAAAPDVSGAVSSAHLRAQRALNSMTAKRLDALYEKLGSGSYGFRRDERLKRGMRRGRSGGSRFYDTRKYYQKAYGKGGASGKPYDNWSSRGMAEYGNWRAPSVALWAESLMNKTTYKDDGKVDGFSGTSTGFAVGLDTVMLDIAAAGVGYAHTATDIAALNRKTTFTSDTLFLYGTFKPNKAYLSAIVNVGSGSYDEDKTVGALRLSDAYDAKQYGAQVSAGVDLDGYSPSVGLRYSAAKLDAREDSAGQRVAAQSFETLTLTADNRWELPLIHTKWTKTGAVLNAGLAYDISRSADKADVALTNGASYTVEGAKPDALTFNAGAEIYWVFGRKLSLSAKYDADVASSYLSHSLSANLSFLF